MGTGSDAGCSPTASRLGSQRHQPSPLEVIASRRGGDNVDLLVDPGTACCASGDPLVDSGTGVHSISTCWTSGAHTSTTRGDRSVGAVTPASPAGPPVGGPAGRRGAPPRRRRPPR